MNRSLLVVSILAGTLMAGVVQAKAAPAQAPAPAHASQHQTLQGHATSGGGKLLTLQASRRRRCGVILTMAFAAASAKLTRLG
jgi:hypothetical protein